MTVPNIKAFIKQLVAGFEALDVIRLHHKSDVDFSPQAQHHTLGPAGFQSSPGDHIHDGRGSRKLYGDTPVAIVGSRGGNVALTNLLLQLEAAGIITDDTSA